MFVNKRRQRGAVYAYMIVAAGLIASALFIFSSSMSSFVFLSTSLDEKTKLSSTITNVSESAKDYLRKQILEGSLTAFPVDTSDTNTPLNGGLIPKNIPTIKTDPWGTRIGVCSYYLGSGIFPAALGASSNGVVRGNSNENMNSIIFAIIIAGKNKIFETECASVSGQETYPEKRGDDIVWMFSVNQIKIALDTATSSGPSLIQGFVDSYNDLASITAVKGDTYINTETGSFYMYSGSGTNWLPVGVKYSDNSKKIDLDISSVEAKASNKTTTTCNTNIPIEIYNSSNDDSFGKTAITSSKAFQIYGDNYDRGILRMARARHESTTPCGDDMMTLSGEQVIGLKHWIITPFYGTVTAGGFFNYSFEDTRAGNDWACVSCTYSSTLSTQKNRRDGYRFFAPDNGTNREIYATFLGAVTANTAHVLTFDYSPSPGGNSETNGVLVYVTKDGVNIGQLQVNESGIGMSPGTANWKRYSFNVSFASSTGIRIYVRGNGPADGVSGLIDNIRLHRADDIRESVGNDMDFNFAPGTLTFGSQTMGSPGASEGGLKLTGGNNLQFAAFRNWNSTQILFTFKNRELPSSDYINPGFYGVDGTTSPGSADLIRSNQFISTSGPVTNVKCSESGYNFNAGAVISDYYGNVYVCQ